MRAHTYKHVHGQALWNYLKAEGTGDFFALGHADGKIVRVCVFNFELKLPCVRMACTCRSCSRCERARAHVQCVCVCGRALERARD